MKYIFLIVCALLVLLSIVTYWNFPENQSEVPTIYWVTDPNPARVKQVATFGDWLVKNGHTTADGKPAIQLKIDASNFEPVKRIIQSVSGIGGDNMDMFGGREVRYFAEMGLISDLTDDAKRLNFDVSQTYPAVKSAISIGDKQYSFPSNVGNIMLWVNKDTFEKYGQPLPPESWTFEEFERMGKAFVAAANEPGKPQTVFFAQGFEPLTIHRSMGLGVFNETMTACILDDPRYIKALKLIHKWTYEDRLIPTDAERHSFSTQSGYGGATPQLLYNGNYGIIRSGRFMLIQLREFPTPMNLKVVEEPNGGYPNTNIRSRSCAVYVDSKHPEAARLFLSYLASEDYNMQIVNDADALPPNPKYAQLEAFNRPKDYPNEWGTHEVFYRKAMTIAIGVEFCPFVADYTVERLKVEFHAMYMENRISVEETAKLTQQRINEEIQRTLSEKPQLQKVYKQRVEDQKRIDELKQQGKKIPRDLIRNPFYLKYYTDKGMVE
ncbi:ABC transporter substrate-binding protein [Poriferisphaera sp. WC338]|uniref:ABC transporter substrate-binding protein n=1 Tax=Poriferisphaera sp. WC338 TaxID=3425129 RepID=UPI003D813432